MTEWWHWLVVALVAVNVLGCWWLIGWSAAQGDPDKAADDTLDHVWDGDLRERNQPLPRWWLGLFNLTILFSILYLIFYPGLGDYDGVLEWSQDTQYRYERDALDDIYAARFARFAAMDWPILMADTDAHAAGARLYAANCSTCHGSDGGGAPGFPNLTDTDWLWGDDADTIQQTIKHGRQGNMPPWEQALGGQQGVVEMVAYVRRLSGQSHAPELADAGAKKWIFCSACHGPEGQGNPQLGAPNLTDSISLYGNSEAALVASIANGRNGIMPAQSAFLSNDQIKVLAAYVKRLSSSKPDTNSP